MSETSLIWRKVPVAILLIAAGILSGCGDDGDDGRDGIDGAEGADGTAGADGNDGADGSDGTDGADGADGLDGADSRLTRLATLPQGAEVTGIFATEAGDLFFNVQHPSSENNSEFTIGTVGVLAGVNIHKLPVNLTSTPVPTTEEDRQTVKVYYGEYQVLGQGGDTFSGSLPEGLGAVTSTDAEGSLVSLYAADHPDFNAYIPTSETEGYLFTNWENVPGGMSRIKLKKSASGGALTGYWEVDNTDVQMIDFGAWGTLANCFGSLSPWGTPLTSEEWGNFGDSTHLWNDPSNTNARRDRLALNLDPTASGAIDADPFPNTYRYHYIVEITQPTSATPVPVKHYVMGRFEHENAIVMPDQKTAYLSQDDTNGVLFKFVADVAGDLSSGTLYAAKVNQDGSFDPITTGFDIEWIELASGNDAEIETWIAEYDAINTSNYVAGKSSYLTDADAIAWASDDANYPAYDTAYAPAVTAGYSGANTFGGAVTAGEAMDNRIAFLESRKAARAKGATAEWKKFEGIYINQKRAREAVEGVDLIEGEAVEDAYVYFAISYMTSGMTDGEGDIRLSTRVSDCGGVYRMKLNAGYDVNRIEPVVMGSTFESELTGAERCDSDKLSQPDNVVVLDDGRIIVGEDGFQTNNTLWLYDPN